MPSCEKCNEGVIETGNNDFPCDCPAGDAAIFNEAGEGQITGAEIKLRNSLPQLPAQFEDRIEYGHQFRWNSQLGCWYSTSGYHVMVMPPQTSNEPWLVTVPDGERVQKVAGHEAEARAFAIAEMYTRQ